MVRTVRKYDLQRLGNGTFASPPEWSLAWSIAAPSSVLSLRRAAADHGQFARGLVVASIRAGKRHMAGPSLQSQGYLPVATATLFPATEIRCDLYLQRSGQAIELYRSHQYPLEVADLERLKQHGIDHVYIRTADADIYRQYLCQQVLHEESVPTEVRVTALREVTRVAFQDAMDANDPHQAADLANDLGREIASLIADQAVALQEVFHILEHDYYTFTHVCNVSTYCVMLARDLGYSQEHELASVATGACSTTSANGMSPQRF